MKPKPRSVEQRKWDLWDYYPCLEGVQGYYRVNCKCVNCDYISALVACMKET